MLRSLLLVCLGASVVTAFVDDGQLSFRNKTYIIGSKKVGRCKFSAEEISLHSIHSLQPLGNQDQNRMSLFEYYKCPYI
jgi:hypothetical protein